MGGERELEDGPDTRPEPEKIIEFLKNTRYCPVKILVDSAASMTGKMPSDILSKTKRREMVWCRQTAFFYLRQNGLTYQSIGKNFNLDHATVIHGERVIENYLFTQDKAYMSFFKKLNTQILMTMKQISDSGYDWTKVKIWNSIRLPFQKGDRYARVIYEIEYEDFSSEVIMAYHKPLGKNIKKEGFIKNKGYQWEGMEVVSMIREKWVVNQF